VIHIEYQFVEEIGGRVRWARFGGVAEFWGGRVLGWLAYSRLTINKEWIDYIFILSKNVLHLKY